MGAGHIYSSVYGRFLSSDPYRASGGPSDPGSWNRYAYVQGDPVNATDASGLSMDCRWENGRLICDVEHRRTLIELGSDGWNALVNIFRPSTNYQDVYEQPGCTINGHPCWEVDMQRRKCAEDAAPPTPPFPGGMDANERVRQSLQEIDALVADINAKIANATEPADFSFYIAAWFKQKERTGGEWDFKTTLHSNAYDPYGNWHYGVVGMHLFRSAPLVKGAAQVYAVLSTGHLDRAQEQQQIARGISYYVNDCYKP